LPSPTERAVNGRILAAPPPGTLRAWIIEHDESWLFIAAYVGLAVVLSLVISLFWLLVVVAGHFALEWVRQGHAHGDRVLARSLWEIKLDIALVVFALALALYMEVILGLVGLQAIARAGGVAARSGARVAAWERAIRGVVLSADDAAQVARAAAARRARGGAAALEVEVEPVQETEGTEIGGRLPWRRRWGAGDRVAAVLGAACLALILLSTTLTPHTPASALATILHELRPLP
jgi:hypothetical protein